MVTKMKGKIRITDPSLSTNLLIQSNRNCNFKAVDKNFRKSLLVIDNDELDFYYLPIDYSQVVNFENHNVEISKVTSINPFNVGQMLRKPNKLDESDFSLFLIENIRLLAIILIGFVLTVTAKFTLFKLVKRRYTGLHKLLVTNRTRLSSGISFKTAVLSLAFSFFLFFNLSMLTNMIKTQKVTVSTSEFINSISKLNKTTKTLVTFNINSRNLFNRLFKNRKRTNAITSSDYANFEDFFSKLSKNEFDCYFYFMSEFYIFASIYYVTLLNRSVDHFVFFKPTIYYESLKALFYRKNLDEKRKKIINYK